MLVYIFCSILIGNNILRKEKQKEKMIRKVNFYFNIKFVINICVGLSLSLGIARLDKNIIGLGSVAGMISLIFTVIDSVVLYPSIKKIRNLKCNLKEYSREIIAENVFLFLPWFAASLFFCVFKVNNNDVVYMICYFGFWIVFDKVSIQARKNILKCKPSSNEKIKKIMQNYPLSGYKVYEYNGMNRKIANAMVDSIFGQGNVYLSDYLLSELSEDEIEAIYLHEVGHVKHHHIQIRNFLLIMIMPILYILGIAMDKIETVKHINIPIGIAFLFGCLMLYLVFVYLYISRIQEYQADCYAVMKTKDKGSMCRALQKLNALNDICEKEVDDKSLLRSHPTVKQRINKIEKIQI